MSAARIFVDAGTARGRIAVALFAVYICAIVAVQLRFAADPAFLHEELRMLFRYHVQQDPNLFAGDYLASFAGAFPQPYLYEGLTRLWLWAGGELAVFHRILPIVCWLALLAGVALAARRVGDRITVVGALGLVAAQPLYLYQITSALPHAFGFPLLVWAIVAMLHGSLWGLVAVTVLSGLLYPAVTPLVGLLLAWQVFVMGGFLRQANRARLRALLLLAVTGGLSLWLVFGSLSGPSQFGVPLAPMQLVEVYPENGPAGRHFFGVFSPGLYVLGKALGQFRTADEMLALPVLLACGLLALYGFFALPKGGTARRVLAGYILCSLAAGLAVYGLKPHHSYRYLLYPIFSVLPLLTVVGLQGLCRRLEGVLRFPDAAALVLLAVLLLTFDSFDAKKAGHRYNIGPAAQQVMDFAAAQPTDSLFAIWPNGESELELIPYVARRPVFLLRKAHYPTYEDYLLTLRARMNALTDAYLATETAPLRALHCRWGVDYLVVERAHFAPGGQRPDYFAPFSTRIAGIWDSHRREDFLLSAPDPAAVVLETAAYRVVGLAALSGAACGVGEAH